MEPTSTKDVAESFPQYLLLLVSRVIRTDFSKSHIPSGTNQLHRLNCVVLGSLVPVNLDVLGQEQTSIMFFNEFIIFYK